MKTGFYELIQGIHKRGSDKSLLAHGELICSLNTTALLATSPSDYRATTNFLEADFWLVFILGLGRRGWSSACVCHVAITV